MSEFDEYRRRRWMRPNAHLYIRHDAHRFMPPGSPVYVGKDVVKYFWPEANAEREERKLAEECEAERAELLQMKQEPCRNSCRAEIGTAAAGAQSL